MAGMEAVEELHFFYDAQSKPAFVVYNGVKYRYVHNLQGDVVGILDAAGNLVVEYRYDAWGKPLSITGSLAGTLGKRNLFRYRGYVYDEENNLYYLKNRYYCATISKFINADSEIGTNVVPLAHGLWAYCRNNPVCYYDPNGKDPWHLIIPDWGYIHREVQTYLWKKYKLMKEISVVNLPNGKTGRIDLLSRNGEVYEIKPNNDRALQRGLKQLTNYIGGTLKHPELLLPSTVLRAGSKVFHDTFTSSDGHFAIDVGSSGNGLIGYNFQTVQNVNTEEMSMEVPGQLGIIPIGSVASAIIAGADICMDDAVPSSFGGASGGGGRSFGGGAGNGRH